MINWEKFAAENKSLCQMDGVPYKIAKFFVVLTPAKKQQFQLLFFSLCSNACSESLIK
jgi:hypothetical protein